MVSMYGPLCSYILLFLQSGSVMSFDHAPYKMAHPAEGLSAASWASQMHSACGLVDFSAVGGTLDLPSAEGAIYYMAYDLPDPGCTGTTWHHALYPPPQRAEKKQVGRNISSYCCLLHPHPLKL